MTMTPSVHPSGASSPGASTSARRLRSHDEEDDSEPESLSFPYSYDTSEFEATRSSNHKLTSRSSSGPAKLSKRPMPSSSSDRLSPMAKLQKARVASSSKLKPSSSQPPRSKSKFHADHPNAEEILHMIDPHFYSSTSSTQPSPSRLGDEKHGAYDTDSRYHASSSHAPDLSRPYTDAEGRLHDPAFRTFDIKIAPHARRARASRSSLGTPIGFVSGGTLPGSELEHGSARSHIRMIPSDGGKHTRIWSKTDDVGAPASLDPLLRPSPASWDDAEVPYGSPEYGSDLGMDSRDAIIVTTRGASGAGSGFAGTNSPNSPPVQLSIEYSPGDGTTASSLVAREELQTRQGPSYLSADVPQSQLIDDRSPISPRRTSSSLLAPPDQAVLPRRTLATMSGASGSVARMPHRPTVVRQLSRSTLYPRPAVDNPFPSHIAMARTASQGVPGFIAPPLSPPASASSQSDDEYSARRRSVRKGRGNPIMGMPEYYLDNEDSPFKPVVVQPVEKPAPKGVVPILFASYHGSRPASPGRDSKRRLDAAETVPAAARSKGKREGRKAPWQSHESDHDGQRTSGARKARSRPKSSSRGEETESEKSRAGPRSQRARPHSSYALQQEPYSFADHAGRFSGTEKPRMGAARSSSIGTAEPGDSHEVRLSTRNQYVPSHHGKSISIRPGVDVIQDDYT